MKILITGGSSDIGAAIAKRRLGLGDEVVITASNAENLKAALAAYEKVGHAATGFVFDLGNPTDSAKQLEKIAGGIDALILNAASRVGKLKRFHEVREEDVTASVQANILGNTWLLARLLPGMTERRFGRIVFISSGTAAAGTARYGLYALTKSALEGLCLNLAVDYGEFNVLTNIVRPGVIATERTKRFWQRTHYAEKMAEIIPQRQIGRPEQVAEVLDPLLSPTTYMNGAVVAVSGGLPMLRSAGVLDT